MKHTIYATNIANPTRPPIMWSADSKKMAVSLMQADDSFNVKDVYSTDNETSGETNIMYKTLFNL